MIINGTKIAEKFNLEMKYKLSNLKEKPCLGIILIGENPSSLKYIKQKQKLAEFVGIDFKLEKLDKNITERELIEAIEKFNQDEKITGYMIQMPIPKHIDENIMINKIDPKKDVDGFHIQNQGKILVGDNTGLVPCTPAGIIQIIEEQNINLEGKIVTVIGRSNIVGKPVVNLLINLGATVINCNSKTRNLEQFTKISDIIISATGKYGVINKEMVKKDTLIIDVGFSVINGKIFGDIADFDEINQICKITPVPGGVGPLTVSNLIKNTLKIYENKRN